MRRRILTATAALTLVLGLTAAPADAFVSGAPKRPAFLLEDLVSRAASWLTGLWDFEGTAPTSEPTPVDPDPDPRDDRGTILDPDG